MHYPWWYVPYLTSPMLIAIVSVVHVLVSHYAVGGGFFLAVETQYAYKTGNRDYLAYIKTHAWFFVLVTVVFGAITGVGIWWTIGLASPLATETLIQTFVFAWAMEYCFFVLEIISALIFLYYWGRLDPKTHTQIGWIYAGAAWISLVLITGITAFMLNAGAWTEHRTFWIGFLNPQFVPQTLTRTGGAFLLASLYVYLHATFKAKDPELRDLIARRSARPALLGAILIVIGGIGWFAFLPESARAALAAASALNVMMVIILGLTIVVFAMMYFGPYRNPKWLSPGFAILFFVFGLAAVSTGEFIREAVRKPYVIYNVVMSNQILPEEIPQFQKQGYLASGTWTKAYVDMSARDDRLRLGETLFMHHCNDCHASNMGYSAVGDLTRGWTKDMIRDVVRHPEQTVFFMPPFAGAPEEADLLTEYLASIAPPHPKGMNYGEER